MKKANLKQNAQPAGDDEYKVPIGRPGNREPRCGWAGLRIFLYLYTQYVKV